MANITYPPPRPLTVGEVLDLSFRIYSATLVKVLPLAALAMLASEAVNIYTIATGRQLVAALQSRDPGVALVYIVGVLLAVILQGAILLRQRALLAGEATGSEFGRVARRVLALILLFIVFTLVLVIPFGVAGAGLTAGAGVMLVGVILLIPACYIFVQWSVAWANLLLTGAGVFASLARSWRLASGSFWRLTAIYTVALIIIWVAYLLITALAVGVAAIFGRGDVAVFTAATTVVAVVMGAIIVPFYTALALAVYGELTVRKEGADIAQRLSASA
jgi:hypothetical protein